MTRSTLVSLTVYGLVAFAGGYLFASRRPVDESDSVLEARAAIATLREAVDLRSDSLEALRSELAAAIVVHDQAVAAADSMAEASDVAIEESEARADSIGGELRARVDSAVAVMVGQFEAEHELQKEQLREQLRAERAARFTAGVRAAIAEQGMRKLEAIVADQAQIIANYERIDDVQQDRIRSLELQRAGGVLLAVAGVACAFLCGG